MAVTATGASLSALVLISASALFVPPAADDPAYPTVHPNDNRLPAGTMVDGVLQLDLEIRQAVELESYSDGVAGWSGMGARIAAAVMPSDSFTAHLTLRRPGTFMYHSHLNDVEQLGTGMYGAILVLPPGQSYDPATDHTFILAWDLKSRDEEDFRFVLNGTADPAPLELDAGKTHRLRIINIAPAGAMRITLVADSTVAIPWTPVALDGADLPSALVRERPGQTRINVGETADFAFTPPAPGTYALLMGRPDKPLLRQELIVR